MDIILWRHAEAEDVNPKESGDMARRLTAKGREQARQMAKWLGRHLPDEFAFKVSPARRCVETAAALIKDYEVCPDISPSGDLDSHLGAIESARRHGQRMLILVGHQPTLGSLAATLLTGESKAWRIRKGGLWWLHTTSPGIIPADLVCALPPRLLPG